MQKSLQNEFPFFLRNFGLAGEILPTFFFLFKIRQSPAASTSALFHFLFLWFILLVWNLHFWSIKLSFHTLSMEIHYINVLDSYAEIKITLESGINVPPWINIAPATFGKNNKHSPLNKRSPLLNRRKGKLKSHKKFF